MIPSDEELDASLRACRFVLSGCPICGGPLGPLVHMQQRGLDGCERCSWVAPTFGDGRDVRAERSESVLLVAELAAVIRKLRVARDASGAP